MFAYIDPAIREKLVERKHLFRINANGQLMNVDQISTATDLTLNVLGPIPLPLNISGKDETLSWYAFVRHTELKKAERIAEGLRHREERELYPLLTSHMSVNSVLLRGDLKKATNPLVRVHSNCLTGDVLGSKRCECGPQLDAALERIVNDESGAGALVYMSGHEGRGIGLWAKAITYLLQDAGQDTYQANRSLGLPEDSRDFSDAAAVLLHFLGGDRPFKLLSNNPKKLNDLTARGLTQITTTKLVVGVTQYNRRYLEAKRKWGHTFQAEDVDKAGS